MIAQQTHIQVKCLHECHMSCMKCHHAHILSHSPTPSHMHMTSVKTVTGITNDPCIEPSLAPLPNAIANRQPIPTPITQPEIYVINMTVYLLWATELFGSHCGSLTPMFQAFHLRGLTAPFLLRPTHIYFISLFFYV